MKPVLAVLIVLCWPAASAAQDARTVLEAASRALGASGIQSISYAGTAAVANFGQSRTISFGLASTTIRNYTRTIDLVRGVSRATGYAAGPAIHGGPPLGEYEEWVGSEAPWAEQLEIWITPWGFLRGAAAANPTIRSRDIEGERYQVITWSPPVKAPSGQPYRVVGYIGADHLLARVETWVGHPVFGDMHVEAIYSNYRNAGGVMIPGRIAQRRVGMEVFVAVPAAARVNPPDLDALLTRSRAPAPAAAPPPAGAVKVAEGVYRITGHYEALAVDLGEFVAIVGGGGDEARGQAILAETRRLFPRTPVRYVVATHPHFDHASVLPPFAAENITILVDDPSRYFVEQALSSPRTLVGDALGRSRRKPRVQGVVDMLVLGQGPRRLELHHLPRFEHSDAMLVAYLPAERILFTADVDGAAPALKELGLAFDTHLTVNPE